jgi:beta-1,4-mannosyl-glycoprotein beta-1,4-N-acetylglucosaminyltransferase
MLTFPKKIIDAFIFFNEIELLKVRLQYLGDQIDFFVIVEANIDFNGNPKKFYLKEFIASLPFSEKIIYHTLHINLIDLSWSLKRLKYITRPQKFLWKIQDAQRNSTLDAIKSNHLISDYVLFGDLDEIPSLEFIRSLRQNTYSLNTIKTLRQRLFYYTPNNASMHEDWFGTICARYDEFITARPYKLRSNRENFEFIPNGGYHLSYFMTKDKIKTKINAIANVERVNSALGLSTEEIENHILEKTDLFGRSLSFVENSHFITEDLLIILQKYKPWIES